MPFRGNNRVVSLTCKAKPRAFFILDRPRVARVISNRLPHNARCRARFLCRIPLDRYALVTFSMVTLSQSSCTSQRNFAITVIRKLRRYALLWFLHLSFSLSLSRGSSSFQFSMIILLPFFLRDLFYLLSFNYNFETTFLDTRVFIQISFHNQISFHKISSKSIAPSIIISVHADRTSDRAWWFSQKSTNEQSTFT